jgi:hypothetical protein
MILEASRETRVMFDSKFLMELLDGRISDGPVDATLVSNLTHLLRMLNYI